MFGRAFTDGAKEIDEPRSSIVSAPEKINPALNPLLNLNSTRRLLQQSSMIQDYSVGCKLT